MARGHRGSCFVNRGEIDKKVLPVAAGAQDGDGAEGSVCVEADGGLETGGAGSGGGSSHGVVVDGRVDIADYDLEEGRSEGRSGVGGAAVEGVNSTLFDGGILLTAPPLSSCLPPLPPPPLPYPSPREPPLSPP